MSGNTHYLCLVQFFLLLLCSCRKPEISEDYTREVIEYNYAKNISCKFHAHINAGKRGEKGKGGGNILIRFVSASRNTGHAECIIEMVNLGFVTKIREIKTGIPNSFHDGYYWDVDFPLGGKIISSLSMAGLPVDGDLILKCGTISKAKIEKIDYVKNERGYSTQVNYAMKVEINNDLFKAKSCRPEFYDPPEYSGIRNPDEIQNMNSGTVIFTYDKGLKKWIPQGLEDPDKWDEELEETEEETGE